MGLDNRNNQPTTAAASNNGHGSNKQTDDRSINNQGPLAARVNDCGRNNNHNYQQ